MISTKHLRKISSAVCLAMLLAGCGSAADRAEQAYQQELATLERLQKEYDDYKQRMDTQKEMIQSAAQGVEDRNELAASNLANDEIAQAQKQQAELGQKVGKLTGSIDTRLTEMEQRLELQKSRVESARAARDQAKSGS